MENEIYKKVYIHSEADLPPKYGKYMTHAVGMGVHLVYFDSENKNKWGKLYDWYLLPLPSVSREKAVPLSKFASLFRRNDYSSSAQIIKSELTGLPVTQVIDGELMVFIASHEPEAPAPSNHKTYYCSVCHKVPVDAENGFDTCSDCVSKI